MQSASTFLDACWDFADKTANGTEDIWWILESQDYPRLWWELTENTPAELGVSLSGGSDIINMGLAD